MSPDTTAFPRQFSRAQWKASADEDDKRRHGVITSRNGPEWQCANWSGQPQTEMHGDRKLILLPSDPPDDPTGRETEHDFSNLFILLARNHLLVPNLLHSGASSLITIVNVLWTKGVFGLNIS
ncbi:hypothetical protein ElyMa_003769900 [Elysia marginata]|uniref:Uncharacterized protein n=1 Tax=Elysia marginata TaxID=1093978 RepID=A0AAV4FB21_9GAST|nr:hypothetical protein ElyMa_003769900 [Elysia marginata]